MRRLVSCAILMLAAPAFAATKPQAAATKPDLAALVECRGSLQDFHALAARLNDEKKLAALGFIALPQINQFMTEFEIGTPIRVFGHETAHLALTGDSIIAVLDLPDPHPLARELQLETGVDTPKKALFGREIRGNELPDGKGGKLYDSAVLNVSNVETHPGKTLVGCSYDLDVIDDAPAPAGSAAPAAH